MRHHYVNAMDNFICGYYMEDTSLCDKIIEWAKNGAPMSQGTVYLNSSDRKIDLTRKNSFDCPLNENPPLMKEYIDNLQLCINEYIKQYHWCNMYGKFANREVTNVQHYPINGGFYGWHCERGTAAPPSVTRTLVYMTYLNDVTDAGETEFYYQKLKVVPEKGLTLIWPTDWTYTHRGIPSPSQEKYIVTGWMNYFE